MSDEGWVVVAQLASWSGRSEHEVRRTLERLRRQHCVRRASRSPERWRVIRPVDNTSGPVELAAMMLPEGDVQGRIEAALAAILQVDRKKARELKRDV
jgi:hypothetical protein